MKKIPGRDIAGLPSALRNALEIKFQQFDEFSLAKYNKEKSVAKRNARDRESDMLSDSDDGGHVLETLKQMVRFLSLHNICLALATWLVLTSHTYSSKSLEHPVDAKQCVGNRYNQCHTTVNGWEKLHRGGGLASAFKLRIRLWQSRPPVLEIELSHSWRITWCENDTYHTPQKGQQVFLRKFCLHDLNGDTHKTPGVTHVVGGMLRPMQVFTYRHACVPCDVSNRQKISTRP